MSCSECDLQRGDGRAPDCEAGGGCPIPPLGPDEAWVLGIRTRMADLSGLVPAGDVLKMYGATWEDVEALAELERGLREASRGRKP